MFHDAFSMLYGWIVEEVMFRMVLVSGGGESNWGGKRCSLWLEGIREVTG